MSVAEQSPAALDPVVIEKPSPTLRARVIGSALFVGMLGVGVGVVEGLMLALFLSSQGGADTSLAVELGLDRGIAFGLLGVILGGIGGAVRWGLQNRKKARS